MNQILDYGEDEQNTSVSKESVKVQPKSMDDYYQKPDIGYQPQMNFNPENNSKKNIKIFAIALGIFAIVSVAIAIGIFFVTNKQREEIPGPTNELPQILMVENEKTVEVTATYSSSLEKLIYTWGEDPDNIIPGATLNTITASIEKPIGTRVLKIKVIAQDGNEAYEEKEYTQEVGPDTEKPTIEFQVTDSKKLKIIVRDNVGIKSFKYYWNEEEPTELTEATGRTEASVELEIKKGRNTITVIAVDESDLQTTEEKEYTGKEAPVITMYLTTDKKNAVVTAKHEKGIAEIVTILNGVEDKKTYEGDLIREEIKLQIKLKPGDNILEIQAKSVDGETATVKGSATAPAETSTTITQR